MSSSLLSRSARLGLARQPLAGNAIRYRALSSFRAPTIANEPNVRTQIDLRDVSLFLCELMKLTRWTLIISITTPEVRSRDGGCRQPWSRSRPLSPSRFPTTSKM